MKRSILITLTALLLAAHGVLACDTGGSCPANANCNSSSTTTTNDTFYAETADSTCINITTTNGTIEAVSAYLPSSATYPSSNIMCLYFFSGELTQSSTGSQVVIQAYRDVYRSGTYIGPWYTTFYYPVPASGQMPIAGSGLLANNSSGGVYTGIKAGDAPQLYIKGYTNAGTAAVSDLKLDMMCEP